MVSRIYRAEAVVLKRVNIGEADRLVTFFTREYGKVKAIAKGIRRISSRRAGHLEIFSRVKVTFHRGRVRDYVSEVVRMKQSEIAVDLKRLASVYFICELVDQLLPEQVEHKGIYAEFLQSIDRIFSGDDWGHSAHNFSQFLLQELGFLPPNRVLSSQDSLAFIEQILERRLKTSKMLTAVYKL